MEIESELSKIKNLRLLGRFGVGEYDNSDYALESGINLSNWIGPDEIFFIKSSEPKISAPLYLASDNLLSSQRTATLVFFPLPFGNSTTVLKLLSAHLIFFKFIFKDTSIDSENLGFCIFFISAIANSKLFTFLSLTSSLSALNL